MNHRKNSKTNTGFFSFFRPFPEAAQSRGRLTNFWLPSWRSDGAVPEPCCRESAREGTSRRDQAPPGVKGGGKAEGAAMVSAARPELQLRAQPHLLLGGVLTVPCCCYLPLPELAHFTSANTLCALWILAKKILVLHNHLHTDILVIFFSD